MHRSDERKDSQSSFDREAFRQAYAARMGNVENEEWARRRRWMSTASSSSGGGQSRPPLGNLNNSAAAPPPVATINQYAAANERSRNISSIEISSPAKRRLWLLGQRYSSASSIGDAHSVAGSSSFTSGTRSIAGPVSPPSLRNKRIGKLDSYNPLQMLLLHASHHDNEVSSVERDISSIHEEYNTPVQGGHLLQLLNHLARCNDDQPTQSPPRHLDVTFNSTDDDDGSSMLSNVSSFISPMQVFCSDGERSEAGSHKYHQIQDPDIQEESEYFSSLCKGQSILSELEQEENSLLENSLLSNASVEKKKSENDSVSSENEDWGLLSSIALSILVVVSILIALSGLFSLQAKVNTWKESLAVRLWEVVEIHGHLHSGLKLYTSRISMDWFLDMMERCETLYLNTMDELLQQRDRVVSLFSLSSMSSLMTQQMTCLGDYSANILRNADVSTMALEHLYRVAKAYYSAIEFFKTTHSSFAGLQASTALVLNTTMLWQQVGVTMHESRKWLVAPLSYTAQEHFSISKSSLTTPMMFDMEISHRNYTTWSQEDDEVEPSEEEESLQIMSPQFWRRQPRAFVKRTLPAVELSLISQRNISRLETVEPSSSGASENLKALVVQRMRNSKEPVKLKKKKRKVRDYYDSIVPQGQSDEKDVFDGIDVMSIASDAIARWWDQHR